jgi:hypothetical protein
MLAQHVGEALGVAVQVGVGDVALLAFLAAPVKRHPVAAARLDMPVQAGVRRVQPSAREPLVERRIVVVEHAVPALELLQRPRLLGTSPPGPRPRAAEKQEPAPAVADNKLEALMTPDRVRLALPRKERIPGALR